MFKLLVDSKKGIGSAIGAVFFIILILASFILMSVIDTYQTKYQNTRETMIAWDQQRIDESLLIIRIEENSSDPNYTYDIILNNDGRNSVSITRVYVYDNVTQNLEVYDRQTNSSDPGLNGTSCEIIPGEGGHAIKVNASSNLETEPYNRYRIVVCTERGRQYSYNYKPSPTSYGTAGYGNYPIIIAAKDENFQYTCLGVEDWTIGYSKPSQTARTLYRLWVNNTTNLTIHFHQNSTMLQLSGKVGETYIRYIVSKNSTSTPDNLVPFSSQSIGPNGSDYLYFAADLPGENLTGWVDGPNPASTSGWLIGFMFRFYYEGETELRYISMPVLPQELTKEP